MNQPRSAAVAAAGAATGVVAAWIKALSEPRLQQITERLWPPKPEQKEFSSHVVFGVALEVLRRAAVEPISHR
jgi:hypothetical protein